MVAPTNYNKKVWGVGIARPKGLYQTFKKLPLRAESLSLHTFSRNSEFRIPNSELFKTPSALKKLLQYRPALLSHIAADDS